MAGAKTPSREGVTRECHPFAENLLFAAGLHGQAWTGCMVVEGRRARVRAGRGPVG
jgi:hypothetical protein